MGSAYHQPSSGPHRASLRRRATALLLAIAVQIVMVMMLLGLSPSMLRLRDTAPRPVVVELQPEARTTTTRAKTVTKVKRASGGAPRRTPARSVQPAETAAPQQTAPLPMMTLSKAEYDAADIARLPAHPAQSADAGASGTGTGKDSGAAAGPGGGPGGQRLYDADWYRKPTHAELATYLPAGITPEGWGMIACRTIDHYHVDDCQIVGESPSGSGLARALRQAAWQFLILPPRIGGRPLVGAWVRIRLDYTEIVEK